MEWWISLLVALAVAVIVAGVITAISVANDDK